MNKIRTSLIFIVTLFFSSIHLTGQTKIAANSDYYIAGSADIPPAGVSNYTDTLMMFDKARFAFRAGRTFQQNTWQKDSIGIGSIAFGQSTVASGKFSFSGGEGTIAKGDHSFNYGFGNFTAKRFSSSIGQFNKSIGEYSHTQGLRSEAKGNHSISMGELSIVNSEAGIAIGRYNEVDGFDAVAIGKYLTALSQNSINVGRYNVAQGSSGVWNRRDHLFAVGNGSSESDRSNALTILKDGSLLVNSHVLPLADQFLTENLLFFDSENAAFRAGSLVNSDAWENRGNFSFATGFNNVANSSASSAFGVSTTASGIGATTFGTGSVASRQYSTAFGGATEASGDYSFAVGLTTKAESRLSLAIGRMNVGGGTPDLWIWDDPLFEIGNGETIANRSNAFTVLKNGTIIGNRHRIPQDGVSLTSTMFFFDSEKAAFRTGNLSNSTAWSGAKVGSRSFASGYNSIASGQYSFAHGDRAEAIAQNAISMGSASIASGISSIALGFENIASGPVAFSSGWITSATNFYSFSSGNKTIASGKSSFSSGNHTRAESQSTFVLGAFNEGGGDPDDWVETDPIFEIGIGTSEVARENAVTVLKNGSTGVGTSSPEANLDIRGSTLIKMNSGGTTSQLTLEETGDDFARLDFKNSTTADRWTIAAKPQSTLDNSRFNIFLENVGNVVVVTGDEKLGVARTPSHPLHVGTNASNGNGAHVTQGGTWTNGSSRTFKENFQSVNTSQILKTLMGLDIQKWEYIGSDEGKHIGPIAEEFHDAFELGNNEKYISTVDIDGVALAAIQALAKENEALKRRLDQLEKTIIELQQH